MITSKGTDLWEELEMFEGVSVIDSLNGVIDGDTEMFHTDFVIDCSAEALLSLQRVAQIVDDAAPGCLTMSVLNLGTSASPRLGFSIEGEKKYAAFVATDLRNFWAPSSKPYVLAEQSEIRRK